jgi:hypothetical protein
MFTGKDYLVESERRLDEINRLGQERLADRVVRQSQSPKLQVRRWLGLLGNWMTSVGSYLQALQAAEVR